MTRTNMAGESEETGFEFVTGENRLAFAMGPTGSFSTGALTSLGFQNYQFTKTDFPERSCFVSSTIKDDNSFKAIFNSLRNEDADDSNFLQAFMNHSFGNLEGRLQVYVNDTARNSGDLAEILPFRMNLIIGGMGGGKTAELIEYCERLGEKKIPVKAFIPTASYRQNLAESINDRLDSEKRLDPTKHYLMSRNKTFFEATGITDLDNLIEKIDEIKEDTEVIIIDEAHFYTSTTEKTQRLCDYVTGLVSEQKTVILSGLTYDANNNMFPITKKLQEYILKEGGQIDSLTTKCSNCQNPGVSSQQYVNGELSFPGNNPAVQSGTTTYSSVCPTHYQEKPK